MGPGLLVYRVARLVSTEIVRLAIYALEALAHPRLAWLQWAIRALPGSSVKQGLCISSAVQLDSTKTRPRRGSANNALKAAIVPQKASAHQ